MACVRCRDLELNHRQSVTFRKLSIDLALGFKPVAQSPVVAGHDVAKSRGFVNAALPYVEGADGDVFVAFLGGCHSLSSSAFIFMISDTSRISRARAHEHCTRNHILSVLKITKSTPRSLRLVPAGGRVH